MAVCSHCCGYIPTKPLDLCWSCIERKLDEIHELKIKNKQLKTKLEKADNDIWHFDIALTNQERLHKQIEVLTEKLKSARKVDAVSTDTIVSSMKKIELLEVQIEKAEKIIERAPNLVRYLANDPLWELLAEYETEGGAVRKDVQEVETVQCDRPTTAHGGVKSPPKTIGRLKMLEQVPSPATPLDKKEAKDV